MEGLVAELGGERADAETGGSFQYLEAVLGEQQGTIDNGQWTMGIRGVVRSGEVW